MTEFSFRVTPASLDDAVSKCQQLSGILMPRALLITRETGSSTEKPHLHGYVELAGRTKSQLDYALTKVFGVKGAGQKQVADVRGQKGHGSTEKCLRYISKGESSETPPDVVCRYGVSETDVIDFHEQYWRVNAEVSTSRETRHRGARKSMYETCKELVESRELFSADDRCKAIWEWARTCGRHVSYHCLRDVARMLCIERDDSASEVLYDKFRSEIFG